MRHKILPAGTKFYRLEVVEFVGIVKKAVRYRFRCECGTEKDANLEVVKAGKTQSCGCLLREHLAGVHKKNKPRADLVGQTFGRLTVVERLPRLNRVEPVYWLCQCKCGNTTKSTTSQLVGKGDWAKVSCGCFNRERSSESNTRHGQAPKSGMTREYRIWLSMLNRCRNPKTVGYKYYGARGISVCERWRTFENFYADLGEIPAPLSIDRINNDGNYEPENVRLATPKEQAANKRPKGSVKHQAH